MIDQAVEELKYEEFKEVFKSLPKHEDRSEPTLDTYFEIGIPTVYMPEQVDRLNFYTSFYSVKSLAELDDLKDEMIDRFGPIPTIVKRLILAATLRYHASNALFERIIMQRENIIIILPKGDKEDYYKFRFVELMRFILEHYKNEVKFEQKRGPAPERKDIIRLMIKNNFESPEVMLKYLVEFSRRVNKLTSEPNEPDEGVGDAIN
jgi:transcription-repair coupling factor (superfamily II helicase)